MKVETFIKKLLDVEYKVLTKEEKKKFIKAIKEWIEQNDDN